MPIRNINLTPSRVQVNFEVPFSNIPLLNGGVARSFQPAGFWRATLTFPATNSVEEREALRASLASISANPNSALRVPLYSLGTIGVGTAIEGSAIIDPEDRTQWTISGVTPSVGEIVSVWRADAPEFLTARTVLEVNGSVIRVDHALLSQFGSAVVIETGNPSFRGVPASSGVFQWLMTSGFSEQEISMDLVEDLTGQASSLRVAGCPLATDDGCLIVDEFGCSILV